MKKLLFLTIIFLLILGFRSAANAQSSAFIKKTEDIVAGNATVRQTPDGGYITTANDYDLVSGQGKNIVITKFDSSGNLSWGKQIAVGTDRAMIDSIDLTLDGGYILAGNSGPSAYYKGLLIKLDSSGNASWQKSFASTSLNVIRYVRQTTDGGYIITGSAITSISTLALILAKFDGLGNLTWIKKYSQGYDVGHFVQQTSDGGYIVAGESKNPANIPGISLLKFDGLGNFSWGKRVGGPQGEVAYSGQQTSDGGYITVGSSRSYGAGGYDTILTKFDSSGNLSWTKTVGGSGNDGANSVQQTSDGGYIAAGGTMSYGAGSYDIILTKFDSFGNLSWAKILGGTGWDIGESVQQTLDGGYVTVGSIWQPEGNNDPFYLIRTDLNGDIEGCGLINQINPTVTSPSAASASLTLSTLSASAVITSPALTITSFSTTISTQCEVASLPSGCQAHNVAGWAWSENIGWISFSCVNTVSIGSGNDFGVDINSPAGTFTGYAWSENIGWIDFAPAGPYPSLPNYSTKADLVTGEVSGWARALSFGGGWDGWIKLKKDVGDGGSDYGVWIDGSVSPSEFKNWAWGSDVAGWLSFNRLNCDPDGNGTSNGIGSCPPAGTPISNYKVTTSLTFNSPPSATTSVDSPNSSDYCGVAANPPVRARWNFIDPGDTQSAWQIQVFQAGNPFWDSAKILSVDDRATILPNLNWGTSYTWRIMVWDSEDAPSVWINGPGFTTIAHAYPSPDFTPSPSRPTVNSVVNFADSSQCYPGAYDCSTGGSISYLWDFGSGSNPANSTKKGDASTTYTTTGSKSPKLTVTDSSLSPALVCDITRPVTIGTSLPRWWEIPPILLLRKAFALLRESVENSLFAIAQLR